MEVRKATLSDSASIASVFVAASNGGTTLDAVIANRHDRFFETAGTDVLVAQNDREEITGYACVLRQAADLPLKPSELVEIHVHPTQQGQGVGKALLAYMRVANQCDTWVRCQRSDERAIAWFMKQGYEYRRTEFSASGMVTTLMRRGVLCATFLCKSRPS